MSDEWPLGNDAQAMSDRSVLNYASGMADALGDGTWKTWSQKQAHEVEETLDSLRVMGGKLTALIVAGRNLELHLMVGSVVHCGQCPCPVAGCKKSLPKFLEALTEAEEASLCAEHRLAREIAALKGGEK